MKKWMTATLSTAMTLSLVLSGCGSNSGGSDGGSGSGSGGDGEQVTIKMFQFKVEIAEQLTKMIEAYESEHPNINIELETVGGGADYGAALKAKFNSNDKPDIFNNGGFSDLDLWVEHLEDLSDEPWVDQLVDVAKEPMTKDGKLYGQPLNLEGYGFIYNKDLFEQAGITELPTTLSELRAAADKLKAADIQPFINGYGEWWVLGNHFVNIPFAQQDDPDAFIASLNDGTSSIPGNEVFEQWTQLFDLTLEYGGANPLQTDYNTQVTEFALGKAAMTQQGNWTQVAISETNPDINIGFLPMPINDDAAAMDKLPVGVPNNWVVHKNSAVKEEAKAFLDWMVSSEVGQRYITEEFKFIPAFTNIEADDSLLGQLAADIIAYSQEGKTLSWNWFKFPGGEATSNAFADAMQAYVGGQLGKDEMLQQFQKTWEQLSKQ
ncbi:extracellular solute-binding protein [Paenibacillus sp. IB182496]|uniref:Extracellular solute-binding protein n=1 Tax=Paenibacillus sabuli TaxID=2772509 RepID=A0A927GRW7_9BACL|nr:extracellular solute-binding protein [Paenibacillus sabuli]MBD2845415.1 extracellular solute-binding protein [Paenibacillus sabuli]